MASETTYDSPYTVRELYDIFILKSEKIAGIEASKDRKDEKEIIKTTINDGKKLLEFIDKMQLFSPNEEFEEISTSHIKYLSICCILGNLFVQSTDNRKESLLEAQRYFKLFFSHIFNYNLFPEFQKRIKIILKENKSCGISELFSREDKILHFRENKENLQKLNDLKNMVKNNPELEDDNTCRDIYLFELKLLLNEAIQNYISSIDEIKLLDYAANTPRNITTAPPKPTAPLKTMTFTRSDLQNKVLGLGYPSQPTMSQDEYLMHEIATGKIITKSNDKQNVKQDEDNSDEDIAKLRNWDAFKDNHRRGSGNRYNHG